MDNLFDERKKMIYEYITSKEYMPMKIKQIAAVLGVPSEDKGEFRAIIDELLAEGKIVLDSRGKINAQADNIKTGKISITQRGFGFVIVEGEDEDVFISESDINGAMHGDKVCVAIKKAGAGRRSKEGRVVSILERAVVDVVGTLDKKRDYAFVISDNVRQLKDVFIPAGKIGDAKDGQKVVARITNYGTGNGTNPEGEIIEILGYPNDKGVDILSIAKACGLPEDFPEAVKKEAKTLSKEVTTKDMAGRKDLREWLTITIDGEDAKDLDDAVTLESVSDGYVLGVHIADVTNYVREGSELDKEAVERGTSAYLVDRVIPMLPVELSNGICSLNQGTDRLALSCIMKMDSEGKVVSHEIAETVIHVDYRMTYTSVNKIVALGDAEEKAKYEKIVPMLMDMKELAEKRIAIRKKQGSIDFDFPECKIILDEEGTPVDIKPYERNIATRIIEEFMLVTNETVAEDYFWQEQPFLYRSHETPDADKMHELSIFVSNFGLKVRTRGENIHPMEIQKLLSDIRGRQEENIVSRLTLRSMKRAKYTVDAEGHFGLASKYYTHFTSPIRRYPDLQIHRIIKENLHGELNEKAREHYYSILPYIADQSSRLERRAEEAEREVHKLKKAQYMVDHIGETYDGVISGVTNWGIYVELENTVEGMIRIEDMMDDDYRYIEEKFCVVGKRTGTEYALGQRVTIEVIRVDLDMRTVDFIIAGE
ncbi:MAG: ribonuclease R [Lachnospiraceae bacterium]|nr:ribonuclease R [Lachnospiraceae bacterium]